MAEAEDRRKEYKADFVAFRQGLQVSLAKRGASEETISADRSVTLEPTLRLPCLSTWRCNPSGPLDGIKTLNLIQKIFLSIKVVVLLFDSQGGQPQSVAQQQSQDDGYHPQHQC